MKELLPEYLAELHEQGRSPLTIAIYRQRLGIFLGWQGDRPLTRRLLVDYLSYLQMERLGREGDGCRPRTIRGHFCALASFWNFAAAKGYRDLPRIEDVPQPRLDKERSVWPTDEQSVRILAATERVGRDAADPFYQEYLRHRAVAVITLLLGLGLRRSDAKNVHKQDLIEDRRGRRLRVRKSKGGETRTIPVPDLFWDRLQAWIQVRDARCERAGADPPQLLIDHHCHPIGDKSLDKAIMQVLLLAGLEESGITAHSLRHGCATLLLRLGFDIRVVQEILGHASLTTTLKYVHADQEAISAAMDGLAAKLSGKRPEASVPTTRTAPLPKSAQPTRRATNARLRRTPR